MERILLTKNEILNFMEGKMEILRLVIFCFVVFFAFCFSSFVIRENREFCVPWDEPKKTSIRLNTCLSGGILLGAGIMALYAPESGGGTLGQIFGVIILAIAVISKINVNS